jgi:hypothetical protein
MKIIANLFTKSTGLGASPTRLPWVSEPLDHPCLADMDSAAISDLPTTNYWVERQSGQIHLIEEDQK